MTTTPRDIIYQALKDTGVLSVGQDPLAEDLNDALVKLNWMIGQWRRKRWLLYHLVDKSVISTGAQAYTIGPASTIGMPQRPNSIEAAYVRYLNQPSSQQYDIPLELISAREDYSRISLKQMGTVPYYLFYDSGFPQGTLYPWPIPQAGLYELHVVVKDDIQAFTDLSTQISLPDEYFAALHYNLCVRLAPAYGRTADPAVVALAIDSLEVLRKANVQVPNLRIQKELLPPRGMGFAAFGGIIMPVSAPAFTYQNDAYTFLTAEFTYAGA